MIAAIFHTALFTDYIVHFLLECCGDVVLIIAYKHVCTKPWHRVAIWFFGTLLASIFTVHMVG